MDDSRIIATAPHGSLTATVSFEQAGKTLAQVQMSASSLDEAIDVLMRARAVMTPPHDTEIGHGSTLEPIAGAPWYVDGHTHQGLKLLAFCHPGAGWIGFALNATAAATIGGYLLASLPEK